MISLRFVSDMSVIFSHQHTAALQSILPNSEISLINTQSAMTQSAFTALC